MLQKHNTSHAQQLLLNHANP